MKRSTYCLFCKSKKFVYTKKHSTFVNWILSGFCAVILSFILYQDLDLRSVVFLSFFIAIAEVFIHLRWRMALVCHECGFDPIIYMRDQGVAAAIVKNKLESRSSNPQSYLKPPLNVPVKIISKSNTDKIVSMSSLSSKQRHLLALHMTQKNHATHQGQQESQQSQSMTLSDLSE